MIEPQEVMLYGLAVRCYCGEVLQIPVVAEMSGDDETNPTLEFTPDLADVWVHSWTHHE